MARRRSGHGDRSALGGGRRDPASLPVVIFPDGSHLVQPTLAQVAEKVGLRTQAQAPFYDLVIVGSGPAGLAAGVYGASEGLRTLIIEREAPGGQAGQSSRIENYLGFPVGLSGLDLARRAVAQATRFGTEILTPQEVTGVRLNDRYKLLTLADGSEVSCHALLVATGVQYRKLDAPGVEALTGAGIYYGAAMTEALSTKGQDVFVIGGGNSAGQAAMYLSGFARQVTILVRGYGLAESMSQYLIDQIGATPNIAVQTRVSVTARTGRATLRQGPQGSVWSPSSYQRRHRRVRGSRRSSPLHFHRRGPATEWLGDLVERDKAGFIPTGPELMRDGKQPRGWSLGAIHTGWRPACPASSRPAMCAPGSVKRIASAVGEGSMACNSSTSIWRARRLRQLCPQVGTISSPMWTGLQPAAPSRVRQLSKGNGKSPYRHKRISLKADQHGSTAQQGYLILADISGFTSFMASAELEHANAIIGELLELIVKRFSPLLTLVEFEGDCVYARADDAVVPRGDVLLEVFREHLHGVSRSRRGGSPAHHLRMQCLPADSYPRSQVHHALWRVHPAKHRRQRETDGVGRQPGAPAGEEPRDRDAGLASLCPVHCRSRAHLGLDTADMLAQQESYEHLGQVMTYSLDMAALTRSWLRRAHPGDAGRRSCDHQGRHRRPECDRVGVAQRPPEARAVGAHGHQGRKTQRPRGLGARNHCLHGKQATTIQTDGRLETVRLFHL